MEDYNAQSHFAHRERDDGRRSPAEVLGFASGVRHREEGRPRLRALHVLEGVRRGGARREAAPWLAAESLTVEHAGEPLSRYDARVMPETGKLRSLTRPRLFGSSRARPQPRLFALNALGEAGRPKALKLEEYSPRSPRR